jgi:tRNA 5-methylaminomethyl-2-thiouridine biosynthesis bifunctional protein
VNNQTEFSNASLHWDAGNRPHSLVYGDIYFSKANALGESTHVFLEGNRLAERWRNLVDENFVIGELGFGSGLNFLNTCRLWRETAPVNARLHYVACELHPFTRDDMQRLHADLPELRFFSDIFLQFYPDHTPGVHQIECLFGQHSVSLTLLYGDAKQMLTTMFELDGFRMDCWFLDGFSPKLNPAMWQESLLRIIANLSKVGATLTTYSVAGFLREGLRAAGFGITKLPGYAAKRHMLFASREAAQGFIDKPQPYVASSRIRSGGKTVCIIGAGLAGCSTAFALARRGWNVVVMERGASIAREGSGNLQGILHYRPSRTDNAEGYFNLHAYLYAIRHYKRLSIDHEFIWDQCGMLQLAVNEKLLARYEALIESRSYADQILRLIDPVQATEIAGRTIDLPGLFLPGSGWMSPRKLCELYLQHPAIVLHTETEVLALEPSGNGWHVQYGSHEANASFETSNVILCNAANAYSYAQTRHYPIVCNLGQVDYYAASSDSQTKTVVCGQGYILPSNGEYQSVGGSFFVGGHDEEASKTRRAEHVRAVQAMDKQIGNALARSVPRDQRIGMRCATPDRMPIVGPVTQPGLRTKAVFQGLYINVAHGSHGLTRTPVCAAYLASLLDQTPFPFGSSVAAVIRPDRF